MRSFALLALCIGLSGAAVGCHRDAPVPAPSDPDGKDLVEGAVVAAVESSGGVRLYKIIHADDYPDPAGPEYHMIAYKPKGVTFQDAANLWAFRRKEVNDELDHILVRMVNFIKRDHRVLSVEPVTDAEKAPYIKNRH